MWWEMRSITGAGLLLLAALRATAFAGNYIDLNNTGEVDSLAINQDSAHASNAIGTTAPAPFAVSGAWSAITINQYGGNNALTGQITSGSSGTLSATYGATSGGVGSEGYNTHSLTIGGSPISPSVTIAVANTATTPSASNKNSVTDSISVTGGALTYGLTLTGSSNSLGNSVTAGGNTYLSEAITASTGNNVASTLSAGSTLSYTLQIVAGNSNTVSNTVSASGGITINQDLIGGGNSLTETVGQSVPVGSYTDSATLFGANNTVADRVDGAGAKSVTVSLGGSGNTVSNTISGAGASASSLTVTGNSMVNYTLNATGGGTTATVMLGNLTGPGGATQGTVSMTQSGSGDSLNVTINGGGYSLGAAGVTVTQSSPNASLTFSATPTASGFTVNIAQ